MQEEKVSEYHNKFSSTCLELIPKNDEHLRIVFS